MYNQLAVSENVGYGTKISGRQFGKLPGNARDGTLRGMKSRMYTIVVIYLHGSIRKIFRLAVIGALLGGTARGQGVQGQPEKRRNRPVDFGTREHIIRGHYKRAPLWSTF